MILGSAPGHGLELAHPLLGAGAALALGVAAAFLSRPPRLVRRARTRLVVRALAALALGLALAGPSVPGPAPPRRVELLDASASFRPRRPGAEVLFREARPAAEAAGVEVLRIPFADGVGEAAPPDATDLGGAIAAALAAGASEVLLASDGLATTPGALEAASHAGERGVPVHAAPPAAAPGRSLAIESIRVPERVRAGAAFEVALGVLSSGGGALEARVTAQGRSVAVVLPAEGGRAMATLSLFAPTTPGLVEIDVRLEPRLEDDSIPEDERARPAVLVETPSRRLVVAAPGARIPAGPLGDLLAGAPRRRPSELATDPASLAAFDGVVLLEASAESLGASGTDALARFVETGGGLLAAGDRQAFGAGGYAGSPLERVLPVLSAPQRRGGRLGLAIALDRSGSMGEAAAPGTSKLAASLAALRAPLAALEAGDLVAGIVFAREPEVVRPAGPLGEPGALLGALGSRGTSGDTDVFPAIRAAIEAVRGLPAERRHVLLVSDGRSEGTPDVRAALDALVVPPEVTLSVIAVGRDADVSLLGALAAKGRGRFVEAGAGAAALEAALSREVDPRRLPPVVEGPVALTRGSLAQAARVEAKPGARTLIAAPAVGPLLVEGEVGAGCAVAFASSDLSPLAEEIAAALERAIRPAAAPGYSLSITEHGARLRIEATAPTVTALAVRISGREAPILLDEEAPRLHRAWLARPPGPIVASLVQVGIPGTPEPSGLSSRPLATAVHAPARPQEHVPAPPDEDLLRAIASASGGRFVGPGDRFPPPLLPVGGGRASVGHIVAMVAAALLALDLMLGSGVGSYRSMESRNH